MENEDSFFSESQEDDFDLFGYILMYLRYWYWFVLTIGLSLAYAFVYLKSYTPIYSVSATLLIKDDETPSQFAEVLKEFSMGGTKKLENEVAVLRSRALVSRVVDALNLNISYWREARSRDVELYTESPVKLIATKLEDFAYGNPLYIRMGEQDTYQLLDGEKNKLAVATYGQPISTSYGRFRIFRRDSTAKASTTLTKIVFQNRDGLINGIIGGLSIAPVTEFSSYLSLSFECSVIEKGKDILGRLLTEYALMSLDDKNQEAANTLRFIEERLKLVTAELGTVEQNVEQYRNAKGITDLGSEVNMYLREAGDNDLKINEVDVNLRVLEGVERYINDSQGNMLAPAIVAGSDPVLSSYLSQMTELEKERSKLAQSVQPGNPYLESLNVQMRNVKQAIRENLSNQRANLLVTKKNLVALNQRLQSSIATIPKTEREFVSIKRQAGIQESLYLLLLRKREETALSYASTVTDSRVIDVPYSNGAAIRPDRNNAYMIALMIGLIIPFSIISLGAAMKTTVQSKKEIEQKTRMKVFGEIGMKLKQDQGEIINANSKSYVSEQIRILRSNIQYRLGDNRDGAARSILITSSISGEGKSFVTLNIAASLALLNKRVIILGLDMRKPQVQQYLNVSNKIGLSTYLIGRATLEETIQVTDLDNVYIAPSGPIPWNPSELLSNGRLDDFLEAIRYSFDYVLIDTPPLSLVTDATLLAPHADMSIYLVRHQKTPKLHLRNIAEIHQRGVFKSLNIVFNAVNYRRSSEYGYGYGYGSKEYYGMEAPKPGLMTRMLSSVKSLF